MHIDDLGDTLITGGINDFDFAWKLESGESLETPEVVIAFSDEGIGGMSRALHDAYREHLISKDRVYASRPIVINNWEATYFNFDTDKLKAIVDAVEGTGIDTLVLDDGWFGKRENETDQARLLFKLLRDTDKKNYSVIYAPLPRMSGIGLALYNRMIRAAAHNIIRL